MNQPSPFPGLSADDVRVVELIRKRLTPLVYTLEHLAHGDFPMNQNAPPNWELIRSRTEFVKTKLKDISSTLDAVHHSLPNGVEVRVSDVLTNLHPYPIPPFPPNDITAQMVVQALLNKQLAPDDQKYLRERVRIAEKFCHVSADQEVEPLTVDEEATAMQNECDEYGGVKRVNTDLLEDDIAAIWENAAKSVIDRYATFEKVVKRTEDEDEDDLEEIDRLRESLGMQPGDPDETPASTPRAMQDVQATRKGPALPIGTLFKFMGTGLPVGAR